MGFLTALQLWGNTLRRVKVEAERPGRRCLRGAASFCFGAPDKAKQEQILGDRGWRKGCKLGIQNPEGQFGHVYCPAVWL